MDKSDVGMSELFLDMKKKIFLKKKLWYIHSDWYLHTLLWSIQCCKGQNNRGTKLMVVKKKDKELWSGLVT